MFVFRGKEEWLSLFVSILFLPLCYISCITMVMGKVFHLHFENQGIMLAPNRKSFEKWFWIIFETITFWFLFMLTLIICKLCTFVCILTLIIFKICTFVCILTLIILTICSFICIHNLYLIALFFCFHINDYNLIVLQFLGIHFALLILLCLKMTFADISITVYCIHSKLFFMNELQATQFPLCAHNRTSWFPFCLTSSSCFDTAFIFSLYLIDISHSFSEFEFYAANSSLYMIH